MTFIAVRCPHCQSEQIVKRGKTRRGTQRYLCQNTACTTGSFLLDYRNRGCLPEVNLQGGTAIFPSRVSGCPKGEGEARLGFAPRHDGYRGEYTSWEERAIREKEGGRCLGLPEAKRRAGVGQRCR